MEVKEYQPKGFSKKGSLQQDSCLLKLLRFFDLLDERKTLQLQSQPTTKVSAPESPMWFRVRSKPARKTGSQKREAVEKHGRTSDRPRGFQRQITGSVTWGFVLHLGFDLGFVLRVVGFDLGFLCLDTLGGKTP